MRSLQICVIGPKQSGKTTVIDKIKQKKELETEDFQVHSFKIGDSLVYLSDAPFDMNKIKPTLALMSEADGCVLCVPADQGIKKLGELVLLINYLNISKGVIAITKTDTAPDKVAQLKTILPKVLAETTLKDAEIVETSSMTDQGFTELKTELTKLEPKQRDESGEFKMPIESQEEIKSGLTKAIGIIETGKLKKYDKVFFMPWGKDFIVQEIEIEKEIVEEAKAGNRVKVLFKGLNKWDLQQGDVLTSREDFLKSKRLKIEFNVTKFFKDELRNGSDIHLNVGMQTLPATITSMKKEGSDVEKAQSGETVTIETQSKLPFAFEKGQKAIIVNPEAHWESIKVVGSGKVIEGLE